MVEKFCLYLTLITNLFICSGVIRHWNSMKTQDPEILKLQKQVDKLLEEYRQEQYTKKKNRRVNPRFNMAENQRHWKQTTTGRKYSYC